MLGNILSKQWWQLFFTVKIHKEGVKVEGENNCLYPDPWKPYILKRHHTSLGLQVSLVIKNLLANAGNVRDMGLFPGSGRSPGEGHGNPLYYPTDKAAWQVCKESDVTEATQHACVRHFSPLNIKEVGWSFWKIKKDQITMLYTWN